MNSSVISRNSEIIKDASSIDLNKPDSNNIGFPKYVPKIELPYGIDVTTLTQYARTLGVTYLGPSRTFPGKFPVTGFIWGQRRIMLVNMIVRSEDCGCADYDNDSGPINVVFLIDTACPFTFLSKNVMETLVPDQPASSKLALHIQSNKLISCHLSPPRSQFADVNVLGCDFFDVNNLSLIANFRQNSVLILKDEQPVHSISIDPHA